MAKWDIELTEAIGKAIPNELSKLSSYLRFIPGIGQMLAGTGAVDAATTAYADTREANKGGKGVGRGLWNALNAGGQSIQGYANPGMYGSGSNFDPDWMDYAGQVGSSVMSGLGGDYNSALRKALKYYQQDTEPYDYAMTPSPFERSYWTPTVPTNMNYDPYWREEYA